MSDTTGPGPQRKAVANVTVSMDGFASDGDGGMGWLVEYAVHEQTAAYFEGIWRGASTALLGRTNYEGFFGFWPAVARDPHASARDRDFATWFDAVEKVVFSRTLTSADWQNARVATDPEAEVRALNGAPGRDILVLSSASIIQALLDSDLLDELRVAVVPAVLGGGPPALSRGSVTVDVAAHRDDDVSHRSRWAALPPALTGRSGLVAAPSRRPTPAGWGGGLVGARAVVF